MEDSGPDSSLAATGPARRALLLASAMALPAFLTACRGVQALGPAPAPSAAVDALRTAIEHEAALVASYAAVTASTGPSAPAGPAVGTRLSAALTAVLSDHRQHLTELKSRLVEPAAYRSATAAHAHGSAAATGASHGGGPILTIAQLERAEQAASDRLITELAGLPPTLAQLFASIAASEATHVPYLRLARRGR